jgi:hypothetical protein
VVATVRTANILTKGSNHRASYGNRARRGGVPCLTLPAFGGIAAINLLPGLRNSPAQEQDGNRVRGGSNGKIRVIRRGMRDDDYCHHSKILIRALPPRPGTSNSARNRSHNSPKLRNSELSKKVSIVVVFPSEA